jgi:hypothetical protein
MRKAMKPRVRGGVIFLLLAGVVFCCLGTLLPLPASYSSRPHVAEVPSGTVGADNNGGGHRYRGALDASVPVPDVSYALLPPAEEVRKTQKRPVNALVLTMLALTIASSFGAGAFLWLLATNARRRWARRSWGVEEDRRGFAATRLGASFLGVFVL